MDDSSLFHINQEISIENIHRDKQLCSNINFCMSSLKFYKQTEKETTYFFYYLLIKKYINTKIRLGRIFFNSFSRILILSAINNINKLKTSLN